MKIIIAIILVLTLGAACEKYKDEKLPAPQLSAKEQCLKDYQDATMALTYLYVTTNLDSVVYVQQLDVLKDNLNNCIKSN